MPEPTGMLEYIINVTKNMDAGTVAVFTDPVPPAGLGGPLSQDEINWLKLLANEVKNRFTPPTDGGVLG